MTVMKDLMAFKDHSRLQGKQQGFIIILQSAVKSRGHHSVSPNDESNGMTEKLIFVSLCNLDEIF